MSDRLDLGTELTKRVVVQDELGAPLNLTSVDFKVFEFDGTSEIEVLHDATLVENPSQGRYYIKLFLDPNIFTEKKTYHMVLYGVLPPSTSVSEQFTYSFVPVGTDPTLVVTFP